MVSGKNFIKPTTPPKYFAIDVDGTFHAEDRKAYEKNRKAFRKLVEAGYVPFCCTGRPFSAVPHVLEELYTDGIYRGAPGIYLNGSIVYNELGEIIVVSKFSEKFIRNLCDVVQKLNLRHLVLFLTEAHVYSLTDKSHCFEALLKLAMFNPELICASADEIANKDVVQIFITLFHEMEPHIVIKDGKNCVLRHSTCGITTINPPNATKATGITKLMELYGLDINQCAFIGDGSNDIEAMQASNISFAVGNATEEVKEAAKYVIEETNEECAFAKAASLLYGINVE